jgi:periplasmic divalent cation tolerance protein
MKSNEVFVVETTCGSTKEANQLGRGAVEAELAACCHLVPIRSCYRWHGKVQEAEEVLVRWKVSHADVEPLIAYVKTHHSYEVPELFVIDLTCKNPAYQQWVEARGKDM